MRRLLVFLGVMWVAANLVGAWVSVDHDRPYDLSFLDVPGKVARIGDDWLYGWGTGLSMPLWFLAIVAVLTVVVSFGGNPTKLGSGLLLLAGGASIAFTLSNQLTHDRLNNTSADRIETAVIGATLLLAGLMVLVSLLTIITTPKQHRR